MLDLFEGLNKTIEEFSLHSFFLVEKSTRPLVNDSRLSQISEARIGAAEILKDNSKLSTAIADSDIGPGQKSLIIHISE
jgi:hypothetical protein